MLHRQGVATADIARQLGISYQFAYNVIKQGGITKTNREGTFLVRKPSLTVKRLLAGGFQLVSHWTTSSDGKLKLGIELPRTAGVYAFVKNDVALYIGVATKSLAQRLYSYANPGPTRSTNTRLKSIIEGELQSDPKIDIYAISVSECSWNGWELDGNLGLEGGIISRFDVPWNERGASPFLA
jgi:hypothetical protein